MRFRTVIVGVFVCFVVLLGWTAGAGADTFDLFTTLMGPHAAGPGGVAGIMVSYHNAGPDPASNSYIVVSIPSGVPVPLDKLTQTQIDDLYSSVVPDGHGNAAGIYYDTVDCEHLHVVVEEAPGGNFIPMVGMDPGVGASVSFDLAIPMAPPLLGGFVIDDPPSLAKEYKPYAPGSTQFLVASDFGRYSRGTCVETGVLCDDLRTCFGGRLAFTNPIAGDLELVNDGTANPTWGCQPLTGFTPGNIAVIERAECEFGVKALNAQDAGATAVVMVNDGRCSDFPDSPKCVINMGPGLVGDQVTIPLIMLSVNDGQPIIDALVGAAPVHGSMGTVAKTVTLDSFPFINSPLHEDPDWSNDFDAIDIRWGVIFYDGFESVHSDTCDNTVP